jgi:O-antigen ligase
MPAFGNPIHRRGSIDDLAATIDTGPPMAKGTRQVSSQRRSTRRSRRGSIGLSFGVLLAFLAVCIVTGGSSRPDVLSLLVLRPVAIAAFVFFAWRCADWAVIRPLAILLAALAAIYSLQLLPLPPMIHAMLPGWERLDAIQRLNGTLSHWRGATLKPDATLNAVFSLWIPAAVLAGLGAIRASDRQRLLLPVMVFLLSSAMLGVLQVAGGADSPFYIYRATYPGYAVGWFSNRNHQAAALACLFPLLRVWAERREGVVVRGAMRYAVAGILAVLVLPMIVVTGSRAGIALGALSLLASVAIMPPAVVLPRRMLWIGLGVAAAAILAFAGSMVMLSRAASLDRLMQSGDLGGEGRVAYLATEWRIITTFWPWGTGAGTFDPAIRMFEPDALLHSTYFNHAHNDFLEMVLVAGLPGVLLLAAALVIVTRWTFRLFRNWRTTNDTVVLARAASIMLWIVIAASVVDYPLRAPLMATLMIVAAIWLRDGIVDEAGRRAVRP